MIINSYVADVGIYLLYFVYFLVGGYVCTNMLW